MKRGKAVEAPVCYNALPLRRIGGLRALHLWPKLNRRPDAGLTTERIIGFSRMAKRSWRHTGIEEDREYVREREKDREGGS